MHKAAWFGLVLVVLAIPRHAQAQVFSGGDPSGYTLATFTSIDPAMPPPTGRAWYGELRACTSGPDFMLIAGFRYDGIWAIGPSGLDNHALEVPILTMPELALDPLFDEDDELLGMAATPARDAVYVGFQPYASFNGCLPILRVELDGSWEVAFSCDELAAFVAGKIRVRSLATASDGSLYAVVVYEDEGLQVILRIDPSGPPMKRAEVILSTEMLETRMADLMPGVQSFLRIAPDDAGRLFVLAQVTEGTESVFKEEAYVLLRLDPDGALTEMTEREKNSAYTGVNDERMYVARSCMDGILYDARDRMLLCGGHGNAFLIDPDEPGHSQLFIPGIAVQATLSAWSGEPVYSPPGGPTGLGACLGEIGWEDHRAYGTFMGTYMMFSWDTTLLDLDDDHALGFEEAARGTDPFDPDSDGGGTCDGLELIGYTDPLGGDDDRATGEPDLSWTSPGLWFGSRAGNSTGPRHALERFGVAAPDGSLLLVQAGASEELVRFTGWDEPLVPTGQKGAKQGHMAAGPDGSVYRYQGGWGVIRARPDGADEPALEDGEILALTGADSVEVTGLAVQPDGTLVIGTLDGHLIAADGDGDVALLYDAFEDFEAAGIGTEEDGCFGGLPCELPIGPISYEPVHGMLFFWVTTDFIASGAFMLHLVGVRPDGHMRIFGDHYVFAEAMDLLGGLVPMDMEPDRMGGLWLLGSGSGQRRLVHLDGRTLHPVEGMTLVAPMTPPGYNAGGVSLSHAWDLMVTPDGRIFTTDGYFTTKGLTSHGLVEVKPVDHRLQGGDLLVVQPELATLSKLMPDGGGVLLHQGEPFEAPSAVAAAEGRVAVGDAGSGAVLVSALDEEGRLGPWIALATVGVPTGMDIDAEGRILVVDGAGGRLLRVGPDGATEVLAEGTALGEPFGVVAAASGAIVVSDTAGNRLVRISATGDVVPLADVSAPAALALVAGQHYVVGSDTTASWPSTVAANGEVGALGGEDTSWPLGAKDAPGGVAAAPDGTVFHAMVKDVNWDWKDPFPTLRVFRITPDGVVHPLVRYGLWVGAGPGDLCRVRAPGEPLPAEPGDAPLPMPIDEDAGESKTGTCGVGASAEAVPFLVLLCLLAVVLARSRRVAVALLGLVLVLVGCDGGGGTSGSTDPDAWTPGPVPSECKGKDLCEPASPPVCVDATASKRCVSDDDGCWVWSGVMSCPAAAPCEEGVCGGPWCAPLCEQWRECGDDGCGGDCGACDAPEVCCDGVCSPCEADCAGRECGWDGATGICGECAEQLVCVDGACTPPAEGGCGEYLNDCLLPCEPWDASCANQCAAWLAPQAKYAVLAFNGCQALMCASCFEDGGDEACLGACVFAHCAAEYAACFNHEGTATCAETWDCAEACASDDQPCIDGCTAEATKEAMEVLIGIVVCVESVCPPDMPDAAREDCEDAALQAECAAQAAPCFDPCEPLCPAWAECGPDGCTGLCGVCPEGQSCPAGECLP